MSGENHERDPDRPVGRPDRRRHRRADPAGPLNLPSFEEACTASPGRIGDVDGAADAVCRLYHGMSLAEYRALPEWDGSYDD